MSTYLTKNTNKPHKKQSSIKKIKNIYNNRYNKKQSNQYRLKKKHLSKIHQQQQNNRSIFNKKQQHKPYDKKQSPQSRK